MLRVLGCIICNGTTLFLSHAGRRVKTKNGSTSLNCTNNIKRFYNARLHAIFKSNEARDLIWFSLFTSFHRTMCIRYICALDCISLISCGRFYGWCGLFRLDSVYSIAILPLHIFLMLTHFPSSLIFMPYIYRYSTGDAIASYINIFYFFFYIISMNSQDTCYNYRSAGECVEGWKDKMKWLKCMEKGGKML